MHPQDQTPETPDAATPPPPPAAPQPTWDAADPATPPSPPQPTWGPAAETHVPAAETTIRPPAAAGAETTLRPPAEGAEGAETTLRPPAEGAETTIRPPAAETSVPTPVVAWGEQPGTDAAEDRPPARRRIPWKRIALTGVTVVLVGVFGSGFGSGIAFETATADDAPVEDVTVEVAKAPTAGGDVVPLPDVRGLALTDAQQAITDAGLTLDVVTAEDTPSALPAGTVVTQDPVGGTEGAERVVLYVAVPGLVPDLVGQDEEAARAALVELGSRFQRNQVFQPGVAAGTVLAVEPPAGSPLPGTVTVSVASEEGGVFLSQLDAIEGGCSADEVPINGTDYANSIYCSVGSRPTVTSYLLDRLTTTLNVTVGITDGSDLDAAARVVVYGDGRVLHSGDVAYGQAVPLTLPTAGVLRLTLEYSTPVQGSTVRVGFGDARVTGAPQDIATLDAE